MRTAIGRILRHSARHWLVTLILLTLIARLVFGWCVEAQLHKTLNAIRARNQPVDPSQLVYPLIPDHENAVPIYRQAVKAMSPIDSPRTSNLGYPAYLPHPDYWMKLAEASEKASAPAFALARRARQRPRAQFATSFAGEADLQLLSDFRDLASKTSDSAEYAHLQKNDGEAIEHYLDLLHMAKSVQSDDYLISYGISLGIDALACDSILLIAPDLSVRNVNVQRLIGELLNEQRYHDNLKRIILNERLRQIRWYAQSAKRNWLLSPLAKRDLLRELYDFDIYLQAADATNCADAEEILSRCQSEIPPQARRRWYWIVPPRYSRWFYDSTDLEPYFHRTYRLLAERRLTAIALACQLYRADHGQFPDSLDQLVPAYLRTIQLDPFSADGRPIGYTIKTHAPPLSGPRPMLYFDPGGSDIAPKAEPLYGWYSLPIQGPPVRQYRDISRFAPQPLKKAVNNYPYQSYGPGYGPQEDDGSPQPDSK